MPSVVVKRREEKLREEGAEGSKAGEEFCDAGSGGTRKVRNGEARRLRKKTNREVDPTTKEMRDRPPEEQRHRGTPKAAWLA